MLNFNPSFLQILISAELKEIKELANLELVNLTFFFNFTRAKVNSLRCFVFGINVSFPIFSVPYKSPEI